MNYGLEVDTDAMDSYPDDVPDKRALFPCKVPLMETVFHLLEVFWHVAQV